MGTKQGSGPASVVKEIRRQTRRKFTAEEKIRTVLEGLKGEFSIAELCRREGIVANLYYRWSKDFLEARKRRLQGDTTREATSSEVGGLRQENEQLKQLVAELSLKEEPPAQRKSDWAGMRRGSASLTTNRRYMRPSVSEKREIILE